VVGAAIESAKLLGSGLYGVDFKQHSSGVYFIEINDNPNIDVGAEDAMVGDALYVKLIDNLLARHEKRHAVAPLENAGLPSRLKPMRAGKKATQTVGTPLSAAPNLQ
jgi:hypothetical protein